MFYEEEEHTKEKTHKILFTGLDGAGKTSIILTLQREFSKIAVIKPTRGAQRTNFKLLGREISEWDLGGQKSYLISYLKNPSKYFDETEIAIYVIDILDHARSIESLSYLYDVIEKFKELKINPPINIFFHKCDPKFIDTTEKEVQDRIFKLQKEIQETVNYPKIQFFSTTIHNPYTIMNAMSIILLELFPKSELLQKTIEEYAKKLSCEGLIIIDKNSIMIGSCFKDDDSKKILSSTIAYFLTLNDVFEEMEVDQQEDQIVVRKLGKYFLFKPIVVKNTALPYYMLVLKEHNPLDIYFINKDFNAFVNVFSSIIHS
ncbi:MAG: ADP-ribosylation factor-like protein [Promethearchaeota archaeon]|jgi:GTPase SAR1 family protein